MQTAIVDPTRVSCERVTIADKRAFIEASDLQDRVVAIIRRKIRVSRRRRSVHQGQRFSIGLLRRADAAVRAEFGAMLPASLDPTRPDIIQVHTPQEIGRLRAPNRDKALTLIGEEALSISQELARERAAEVQRRRVLAVDPADFDVLRLACIRDSRDPALREALSQPVLDHLSLARIQELQATQIPGVTSAGRRIDIVARNPYLGHILVHELIHFYEHPDYRKLRSPDPHAGPHPHALALREGGSEFLARHVIQTRLIQGSSAQPDEFRIRFETYRSEAQFISEVVRRMGGVESYARAYFQGRIDLITAVLP